MSSMIEIKMPEGQQEGTESVISRWLKTVGDLVQQHEPLIEISTDKVMVEVPSPGTGVLRDIFKNEADKVEPGMLLGLLDSAAASTSAGASSKAPITRASTVPGISATAAVALSPAVKKLLQEHNLTADMIPGSGRGGRISHQDVLDFVAKRGEASPSCGTQCGMGKIPSRLVKHDAMRRSIAQHMVHSLATAPHVTSVFEVDLSAVLAHREFTQPEFNKEGLKLTLSSYFIKATVVALQAVPEVNSRWRDDALEVYEDLNIGVATALGDKGLIVPVIRRAQTLDLRGISQQLQEFTTKARDGKLDTKDVQDGTFTISNHGVSGSLVASPIIINQPQSAILGIGKLEKRVVVIERNGKDEFVARPSCYVTLTIDHRVLDGFLANKFLSTFVQTLETWR